MPSTLTRLYSELPLKLWEIATHAQPPLCFEKPQHKWGQGEGTAILKIGAGARGWARYYQTFLAYPVDVSDWNTPLKFFTAQINFLRTHCNSGITVTTRDGINFLVFVSKIPITHGFLKRYHLLNSQPFQISPFAASPQIRIKIHS